MKATKEIYVPKVVITFIEFIPILAETIHIITPITTTKTYIQVNGLLNSTSINILFFLIVKQILSRTAVSLYSHLIEKPNSPSVSFDYAVSGGGEFRDVGFMKRVIHTHNLTNT